MSRIGCYRQSEVNTLSFFHWALGSPAEIYCGIIHVMPVVQSSNAEARAVCTLQRCFVFDEGAAGLEASLMAGRSCTALLTMRRDDDTT